MSSRMPPPDYYRFPLGQPTLNPPLLCPVQRKGQSTCQGTAGITATHQDSKSSAHSPGLSTPQDASHVSAFRKAIVQTHLDHPAKYFKEGSW